MNLRVEAEQVTLQHNVKLLNDCKMCLYDVSVFIFWYESDSSSDFPTRKFM